jgi:hypothetical protein
MSKYVRRVKQSTKPFASRFSQVDIELTERCNNDCIHCCIKKGFCEQCPAKSWVEYGTLDTPIEYLCEVAHAQARYLGWLGENEQAWQVIDGPQRVRSSLVKVDGWCIISKDAARQ